MIMNKTDLALIEQLNEILYELLGEIVSSGLDANSIEALHEFAETLIAPKQSEDTWIFADPEFVLTPTNYVLLEIVEGMGNYTSLSSRDTTIFQHLKILTKLQIMNDFETAKNEKIANMTEEDIAEYTALQESMIAKPAEIPVESGSSPIDYPCEPQVEVHVDHNPYKR